MDYVQFLTMVGPSLVAGGVAYGGAKAALNGTRLRVKELEASDKDKADRLARIETKIDILLENRK